MPNNEQQNNVQKKTNLDFLHFVFLEKKVKFFSAFFQLFWHLKTFTLIFILEIFRSFKYFNFDIPRQGQLVLLITKTMWRLTAYSNSFWMNGHPNWIKSMVITWACIIFIFFLRMIVNIFKKYDDEIKKRCHKEVQHTL